MQTPVSILYKSIAGRYRPVRVADGPIAVRYRFIKNASWDNADRDQTVPEQFDLSLLFCSGITVATFTQIDVKIGRLSY